VAHGGRRGTTVCQLSMRFFKDGDSLTLEPWRSAAFPIVRDLIVNRSAFDRIIQLEGSSPRLRGAPPPRTPSWWRGRRRHRVRRGGLHRLRRVRRRLPELGRDAVHLGQAHPPQLASAGSAAARREDAEHGRHHGKRGLWQLLELWRMRGGVPQGIPLEFIGKMNRDLIRALWNRHREALVVPSVVQVPGEG